MKVRQTLMATGAAIALATMMSASPAHANGGHVQFFGGIHVQPVYPVYAPHPVYPIYVNPNPVFIQQPVYVNPCPVIVAPPVVYTPPQVVVTPPVVVPAMADLAVTGYKLLWVHDANGVLQRMLIFQVANLGTQSANATLASVSLGGDPVYVNVPALLPGQSTSVSVQTNGVVSPGTTIRIVADVRNEVVEPDKGNNQLVDRWTP